MEHGPFQPDETGQLIRNKYSWNSASNMLYLESPIGVGFSYSNTSDNYKSWNDTLTAADNLKFLINWLEEFPKYKYSDLYLTGESYAGHYVPQLAELIVEYNQKPDVTPINLKAIALGNPLLDLDISVNAADYLWSHGAISDETLELERTVCNDTTHIRLVVHNKWSAGCNEVFNRVADEVGADIDSSDLLLPLCLSSTNAEQFKIKGKHASIHAKLAQRKTSGDPCLEDRIFKYLNRPEVQTALHANTTHLPHYWDFCVGPLVYQEDNLDMNIIPVVTNLIRNGIPLMLFSGDQDTKIPLTQTRIIANILAKDLKLTPLTKYGPWYNNKQVGGWAQSFSAVKDGKNVTYLTYATVRGAAHEVPFTSPSQGLTLFQAFLTGSPLPSKKD
ncbi:Serine carboxypeptidase-like [Thalictrum thalictroides]|uniref:Carboxypeptidase n=1 Tax=Thalictrum thalictroides TaxID=46969 RepID=A0A7J6V5Z6_THATH|nr:Serine carboxypeptidase-like [Thalictrum thalictroides]